MAFSKGVGGSPAGGDRPRTEAESDATAPSIHPPEDDTQVLPPVAPPEPAPTRPGGTVPAPVPHHYAPAARPPAPAGPPASGWAFAARLALTLAAAGALIVGGFLDWIDRTSGVSLDVRALWESTFRREDELFVGTVGFVVVVIGLVALIGMAPASGWLTGVAGMSGVAAVVLFLIQVYRDDRSAADVESGVWMALGAAILALVAAFVGNRRRRLP